MRHYFYRTFLIIIFNMLIINAFSAIYYVSKSGNDSNDGTTWGSAVLKIQTALNKCVSGDSVWVASGTYTEGKTIEIYQGISLYGGFAGTETSLEQRNPSANASIIDGNKSYQCVINYGVIDGFTIRNGNGHWTPGGVNNKGELRNCVISGNSTDFTGGGVQNSTSGIIVNCIVIGNYSLNNGSGICSDGGIITNCTIAGNSSDTKGAVYNYNTLISNCIIWKNYPCDYSGLSASGISFSCFGNAQNVNNNINSNPQFENADGTDTLFWNLHLKSTSPCIDLGNISAQNIPVNDLEGNARPGTDNKVCMGAYESPESYVTGTPSPVKIIYVSKSGDNSTGLDWSHAYNKIMPAIQSVIIENDLYEIRIAAGTYKESAPLLVFSRLNCTGGWSGNVSNPDERNIATYQTIIDGENTYQCFKNYGQLDGLYIQKGKSQNYGGGVEVIYGTLSNCIITQNSAWNGGGVNGLGGLITNCFITGNSGFNGGGAELSANCIMANTVILGNTSSYSGGGIRNYDGLIVNCTIAGNSSIFGCGVQNDYGSVVNSIIWNNYLSDYSAAQNGHISYSCFSESDGTNGNIRANPLFVNISGTNKNLWDMHLKDNSPCVDTGNISAENMPSTDKDGNPRPGSDGKVCMGAYESPDDYIAGSPESPKIIYVSKNGDNSTGADWTHAYKTILKAIQFGYTTPELYDVRVAAGEYKESSTSYISSRVRLYGGWSGNVSNPDERDIKTYKTIINGNKSIQCLVNNGLTDGVYILNGKTRYSGGGAQNNGVLSNSVISGCSSSSTGGGVYNPCGKIINCFLSGNSSNSAGGGSINSSESLIINSVITGNLSEGVGGGVYNQGKIVNCTITANSSATTFPKLAGGIFNSGKVTNSIIWYNYPSDYFCDSSMSWYSSIVYSCFSEAVGTDNNFRSNPMFTDTSAADTSLWNLRLADDSPCIDAGNAAAENLQSSDIEGNPRPGGDGKVCIGAYESPDANTPGIPASEKILYVSKSGDNTTGADWNHAYNSILPAVQAANSSFDLYEIRTAAGLYNEGETIIPLSRARLTGGWSGNINNPEEHDISNFKTIIDGEKSYQCFRNYGAVDGCHIRNGVAAQAGGIYSFGPVTNCTISGNESTGEAGGIYLYGPSFISNCYISENSAGGYGGGVICEGKITDCIISNNMAAGYAGGALNAGEMFNCKVFDNSSMSTGGGLYNFYSGSMINSLIYGNSSLTDSGGIYNEGLIVNSTIAGNVSPSVGGVKDVGGNVYNSIMWQNSDKDYYSEYNNIEYSCFREADGKKNNINSDPLLEDLSGTDTLKWNLRLQSCSPCIDTGMTASTVFNSTSEVPITITDDIEGVLRPYGSKWDRGAYEYHYASGDVNKDGKTDKTDQSFMNNYFCGRIIHRNSDLCIMDINEDGIVDISDEVYMLNQLNRKK